MSGDLPNPRDYPDPIGYAVASADWWRAQVHVDCAPTTTVCAAPIPAARGTELEGERTP